MLKALRENFKHLQWILWVVIAIFVVFVFVDWGMGTSRNPGGDTGVAAQAGSIRITTAEFQREYKDAEERYRQMYGGKFTPEMARVINLPEQVLNGLIDRRLMREEAQRLRLSVTDEELSAKILGYKDAQGRPIFVRDGVFVGDAQYRRMLAGAGYVPESFEGATREQILLEKLNRLLTSSVVVSDQEIEDDYAGRSVKAKIAYVLSAPKPDAAAAAQVPDAEAEAWFKQNPGPYLQPEKRKAKYLLVETTKVRNAVQVSEADVKAEYEANPDTYRKPEEVHARHILYRVDAQNPEDAAKAKAEAAVKKLKAGADFAALARAESEDPGSKGNGGDLGSFSRGRMDKAFEEAAFSAEPHKIAGPVKSVFGWHVIEVLEKAPERVQPITEVAPAIRARLQDQRAADEARRVATDLAGRLSKQTPSDEEMRRLATGNVTFNETDFFGKSDTVAGVGFNPNFNQAVFALKANAVTGPIDTTRGPAIVKLVEIKQPGLPTFAEVKTRVIDDLKRKKQSDAAAAALKQAMTGTTDLDALAKKLDVKVETPEAFGKNGPVPGLGGSKALLDAAFAAKVGDVAGPVALGDRGAVVFKVLEKSDFDKPAFEKQKETIRESLRRQKADRLLQALIQKRRSDLKLEINRDLLTRFAGRA